VLGEDILSMPTPSKEVAKMSKDELVKKVQSLRNHVILLVERMRDWMNSQGLGGEDNVRMLNLETDMGNAKAQIEGIVRIIGEYGPRVQGLSSRVERLERRVL